MGDRKSEGGIELTKEINAGHAEAMLEAYCESVQIDYARNQHTLTDALVTLRHYAAAHHLSFQKAFDGSAEIYQKEIGG